MRFAVHLRRSVEQAAVLEIEAESQAQAVQMAGKRHPSTYGWLTEKIGEAAVVDIKGE